MRLQLVDLGLRHALKTNPNPVIALIEDSSVSLHCGRPICGIVGKGVGLNPGQHIDELVKSDAFRKAIIAA